MDSRLPTYLMLCGEETIPPTLDSAGPSLCGQRGSTVSSSHTTLKRDVERDTAVSGTKSPLSVPVLEHLTEVHLSISPIRQLARPLTTSTATSERHQRAQAPLTGYA